MTSIKAPVLVIGLLSVIGSAAYFIYQQNQSQDENQAPTIIDNIQTGFTNMVNTITGNSIDTSTLDPATVAANRSAFLTMISTSEGTNTPNGYFMMFGGTLCDNLDQHPNKLFSYTNTAGVTIKTSAAGRYQFTYPTWQTYSAKMGLTDFSPDSQDAAAIALIDDHGALDDVDAGDVPTAISKLCKVWASFPNSNVNQPTRSIDYLLSAYTGAGGALYDNSGATA